MSKSKKSLKRRNKRLKHDLYIAECGLFYLTDLGRRWKHAAK